ncbi:hypothetical protein PSPO01_16047 [Paraphaeosphaeria sporulosa]
MGSAYRVEAKIRSLDEKGKKGRELAECLSQYDANMNARFGTIHADACSPNVVRSLGSDLRRPDIAVLPPSNTCQPHHVGIATVEESAGAPPPTKTPKDTPSKSLKRKRPIVARGNSRHAPRRGPAALIAANPAHLGHRGQLLPTLSRAAQEYLDIQASGVLIASVQRLSGNMGV